MQRQVCRDFAPLISSHKFLLSLFLGKFLAVYLNDLLNCCVQGQLFIKQLGLYIVTLGIIFGFTDKHAWCSIVIGKYAVLLNFFVAKVLKISVFSIDHNFLEAHACR